jgi:RNA polymerase sigma-B factor
VVPGLIPEGMIGFVNEALAIRRETRRHGARRGGSVGRTDDELLRCFAAHPDPALREELVRRYLPLARHIARRFSHSTEPLDDLVQVASLGLLKALSRFDPERGVAFSSYALPTMSGELRRHFRDHGWNVRPPRDLQEHALLVDRTSTALYGDLGRPPTIDEIAERVGLSVEAVLEAREAIGARHATSMAAGSEDPESSGSVADWLGRQEDGYGAAEDRATIEQLAHVLTPREREILRLRFQEDMTQGQIGAAVGLSQMQISRLLRDIMSKLRAEARGAPALTPPRGLRG